MSDLSCDDIIASWIESDPVGPIGKTRNCQESSKCIGECIPDKVNGSKSGLSIKTLVGENHKYSRDELNNLQYSSTCKLCSFCSASDPWIRCFLSYEPERMMRSEIPAPPPTLHANTRWRILAKRLCATMLRRFLSACSGADWPFCTQRPPLIRYF